MNVGKVACCVRKMIKIVEERGLIESGLIYFEFDHVASTMIEKRGKRKREKKKETKRNITTKQQQQQQQKQQNETLYRILHLPRHFSSSSCLSSSSSSL